MAVTEAVKEYACSSRSMLTVVDCPTLDNKVDWSRGTLTLEPSSPVRVATMLYSPPQSPLEVALTNIVAVAEVVSVSVT